MRNPIDLANALRTLSRQFGVCPLDKSSLEEAAASLESTAVKPTNAEREALAAQLDDFAASLAGDIREQRPLLAEAANALRAMPSDATPEVVEKARRHRATLRVMWARDFPNNANGTAQKAALEWAAFDTGVTMTPRDEPMELYPLIEAAQEQERLKSNWLDQFPEVKNYYEATRRTPMTPHDKPEELYPLIAAAREDLAEQLRSRAIVIEASGCPDQLFREDTARDLKRAADMLASQYEGEDELNDAEREIRAKAYLESAGWSVRGSGSDNPIPMLLRCPFCNERHVDEGEFATRSHETHACQNPKCGELFTPALVPTVGVRFLPGCKNES